MEETCSRQSREILHDFQELFDPYMLNRIEDDTLHLVTIVQKFHKQFLNDQQTAQLLNRRIEKLEEDLLNQKKEVRKLEDELKDVRSHFAAQLEENRVLKAQLKNEQTVKTDVKKESSGRTTLSRFSQEATQTSDDYTTGSEENLLETSIRPTRMGVIHEKRTRKRRSRSVNTQVNINRASTNREHVAFRGIMDQLNYQTIKGGRTISDPGMIKEISTTTLSSDDLTNDPLLNTLVAKKSLLRTGSRRNWTSGRPIEERQHKFVKASVMKMTTCDFCSGPIYFTGRPSLRCTDCQQYTHETCKAQLSIPCVPRAPKTPAKGRMDGVRIQDFCPTSSPMIPYPIIHCVVALERREALTREGLYRVSGEKYQVIRLLQSLKSSRGVPKMDRFEIEVIADCIKDFLGEFKDPLIPRTSRNEFIDAAIKKNYGTLNKAIEDLPQPHRDTLAYLCIHWQKVIARKDVNKMTIDNVARFVAPAVVGSDMRSASTSATHIEARRCVTLLVALLSKPTKEWEEIINPMAKMLTPNVTSGRTNLPVDMSILGPVTYNNDQSNSPTAKRPRQKKLFDDPF